MYCHNCGHKNPDDANFCGTCGAPLRLEDQADTTVTFLIEGDLDTDEEFTIPLDELEEGKAILLVRRGPEAGTKFFLDKDVTTCGRDQASDVFLNDVTVSRRHAEIKRKETTFSIADVGSLNGTFVNKARVDEVVLSNGDEIQIGKFRLIFFTGGTPSS